LFKLVTSINFACEDKLPTPRRFSGDNFIQIEFYLNKIISWRSH